MRRNAWIAMAGVVAGVGVCVAMGAGSAAAWIGRPHERVAAREADKPWAFLSVHGGRKPGAERFLDFAVWEDGAYLYRKSPKGKAAAAYVVGKLGEAELAKLKEGVAKENLIGTKVKHYTVPDADSKTLTLKGKKELEARSWDETILRGWGANSEGSEDYREFAKRWTGVRILFVSATPAEDKTLTEELQRTGAFRGFDAEKMEWSWMKKDVGER